MKKSIEQHFLRLKSVKTYNLKIKTGYSSNFPADKNTADVINSSAVPFEKFPLQTTLNILLILCNYHPLFVNNFFADSLYLLYSLNRKIKRVSFI